MKRMRNTSWCVLVLLSLLSPTMEMSIAATLPQTAVTAQDYDVSALFFVENRGQVNDQVAYYLFGGDKDIYFTSQGITFALTAPLTPTTTQHLPLLIVVF